MTLMTVRIAATRLGVGYSTLKQWIHHGRVRTAQTPGGHHRISEAEVDRLIARSTPPERRTPPASTDALEGLSARNQLPGFVEEVRIDGLLGQVRLRIGDHSLTAVITADAIRALRLRRGDDAVAVIKSTEVMIARRAAPKPEQRSSRGASRRSGVGRRGPKPGKAR
jgi:molybdopterin-binding protein